MMVMKRQKMGEILLGKGLIDEKQLQAGLSKQRQWGQKIGETLVTLGVLSEEQLAKLLGEICSLPAVDLNKVSLQPSAASMVDRRFCLKRLLVPVAVKTIQGKEHLVVAFSDPMNLDVIDELRFIVSLPVFRIVATAKAIKSAIDRQYGSLDPADSKESAGAREIVPKQNPSLMSHERTLSFDDAHFKGLKDQGARHALKSLVKMLRDNGKLSSTEAEHIGKLLDAS